MSRTFTAQDLWNLPRVGNPTTSPDGSVVIVPVTHYDIESDKGFTRLYRLDPETGASIALTAEKTTATSPSVSPDGTNVAFLRPTETGKDNLHLLPLNGGEARCITDLPLGGEGPKWLPDGRLAMVVALYRDAPTVAGTADLVAKRQAETVKATEERMYRYWDTWLTDGKIRHPFVLDPADGSLTDLTPDHHYWWTMPTLGEPADALDVSPDGTEIAYSAWEVISTDEQPRWSIWTVPTTGGIPTSLTPAYTASARNPRYSPDGNHLVFVYQREPDYYADHQRLGVVDRTTGEHSSPHDGWDRSIGSFEMCPTTGRVIATAEDEGRAKVYRLPLSNGPIELIAEQNSLGAPRPTTGGYTYLHHHGLSQPPEIARVESDGGTVQRVSTFTDDVMDGIVLGSVAEHLVPGANGDPAQMFVVYPPDFDPSTPKPLVHMIHGGPHGTFGDAWHFRWSTQAFAAPGYIVALVNFHGSTSWGDDFARSIHGSWGDQPLTDVLAATDALLATGHVDERRMAVTGGSYGGYLTAWLTSQTDRFACAVAHAAVTNLGGMYATDGTYGFKRSRGAEVWEDPTVVDRWSPSHQASGYATPTLVTHGERDFRVPVTQGLEFYGVLKSKGVPARLVYFPDENHWILKPRNSLRWYEEVHGWLERWLS